MTKTLNTTFAATFIAASLLGGSLAFAGGDYYRGVSPTSEQDQMIEARRQDRMASGYVHFQGNASAQRVGPANGDYYPGLDRSEIAR